MTSGQGDYLVNGSLSGTGTIGLATGAAVQINAGGILSPSIGFTLGANDVASLAINGNLAIGAGGNMTMDTVLGPQILSDYLDINGVLDLSAVNDNLFIGNTSGFASIPQQSFVIASYESRIGQFDLLNNGTDPKYQILYTSPSGGGPGQVIIVTPEPSAAACLVAVGAIAMRRRVRSGHA